MSVTAEISFRLRYSLAITDWNSSPIQIKTGDGDQTGLCAAFLIAALTIGVSVLLPHLRPICYELRGFPR
jgi:hypothetical protein